MVSGAAGTTFGMSNEDILVMDIRDRERDDIFYGFNMRDSRWYL